MTDFIKQFQEEIHEIATCISSHNPLIVEYVKANKDAEYRNINCSVLSIYLQEYEVRILEIIYNFCVK